MSILSIENLHKTYGEKVLFENLSFTISEKQRIGLIGVNGTGKSTLLKVMAGIESKEGGSIVHANDFRVEYLSQNPVFSGEQSVIEHIYFGDSPIMKMMRNYERALHELEDDVDNEKKQEQLILVQQQMEESNAWEANTVAKTILTKLGVTDFFKPVSELSGGQKKRVAIAKALIHPADLLLLDEPTNHLDNETIEWLEGYLQTYKGALILVTHDRYFLNRVVTRIFELDRGSLYSYQGNYEIFLEKKAEREENDAQAEDKKENLLRRELAWLRRGAKARTTKQKARIHRVEDLRDQKKKSTIGNVDIAIGSTRLGKKVMELQGVSKSVSGKNLVRNFNYLVVPEDRIGIIGPNGSGKTTLLNMIAGKIQPDTGDIEIGPTVKLGYYTQEYIKMNEELRVIEYIKEQAEVIQTINGDVITAEQMLERFLFSREHQWTYIRKLSGGERRRLYLLRVLMSEPNVLLLDEPTNDLDVQTLTILEDYLDYFPGVVITVSHDRYFLDRVVEHLFAFEGDGKIERFHGNYSEYLEKRKQERVTTGKSERKKDQSDQRKEKKRKLSYNEQREWEGIEDLIASLEKKNEVLQAEISNAGSDTGRVSSLFKEQQALEVELEKTVERWTELSLLIEEIEQNN